jgi:hypothetical protein
MERLLKVMALLATVAMCACVTSATDDNLKAATTTAEEWLAVVDAGHYAQSWDKAASLFQAAISQADWQKSLDTVRAPLGKVESRTFKNAAYKTKLPNVPDGKYFIVQYDTRFSAGGAMIETVVPMLDKDGQWKVSGYFIKPAE